MHGMEPHEEIEYWRDRVRSADQKLATARAEIDVLKQECEEWSALCNQQHRLLEARGNVAPTSYKCGWCVRAVGGDDAAWQAAPSMTLDDVQAHTLKCPHNPLVAKLAEATNLGTLDAEVIILRRALRAALATWCPHAPDGDGADGDTYRLAHDALRGVGRRG